jgi:predicted house-cleaning noncanonical NTP pyrophosphatase (MazG superfamily)
MSELTPAPKGYPIKLVRDDTQRIINDTGEPGELFYDELPVADRAPWLRRKLMEEATEYVLDPAVDELADVLAVVEGLAALHGTTLEHLLRHMRRDPRGGFLAGRMMYGYHAEFDGREAAA